MTFGRFQTPTEAHLDLFMCMNWYAFVNRCDWLVFVSPKTDNKKNPLTFNYRLTYLEKCVGSSIYFYQLNDIKNPYDALFYLGKLGYEKVIILTGSDEKSFDNFKKYINHPDPEKCFPNIKEIEYIIFGEERFSDFPSSPRARVSSTRARDAAKVGNFELFSSLVAGSFDQKLELYSRVIEGMKG